MNPFVYQARLVRVVDGDTVDLWVDQGFRAYREERFRLLGVNTPEMHARDPAERAKAQAAKEWLQTQLSAPTGEWPILIRTEKADAFGRWLAQIWVGERDINAAMLEAGHAKPFRK